DEKPASRRVSFYCLMTPRFSCSSRQRCSSARSSRSLSSVPSTSTTHVAACWLSCATPSTMPTQQSEQGASGIGDVAGCWQRTVGACRGLSVRSGDSSVDDVLHAVRDRAQSSASDVARRIRFGFDVDIADDLFGLLSGNVRVDHDFLRSLVALLRDVAAGGVALGYGFADALRALVLQFGDADVALGTGLRPLPPEEGVQDDRGSKRPAEHQRRAGGQDHGFTSDRRARAPNVTTALRPLERMGATSPPPMPSHSALSRACGPPDHVWSIATVTPMRTAAESIRKSLARGSPSKDGTHLHRNQRDSVASETATKNEASPSGALSVIWIISSHKASNA